MVIFDRYIINTSIETILYKCQVVPLVYKHPNCSLEAG